MTTQHRPTGVNDRLREIISRIESSPHTNQPKLLEPPTQPIHQLPKKGN